MADLFWPGDERAAHAFAPSTVLVGLVEVEDIWLQVLVSAGVAPPGAKTDLAGLVGTDDVERVALAAEPSGNPVVPLLTLLRERLAPTNPDAARWLHRGLTSQDVLDTGLVLCARSATERLVTELDALVAVLAAVAARHRDDVMAGRTLTQHAVPITFGLKAAQWLQGVLDARDDLRALRFPVQVGGAAGTLASVTELASTAHSLVAGAAQALRLDVAPPWHTVRTPLTRYADALARTTDAFGHIANDVLLLARPEIGELAEPSEDGRGGSSTMPHKANPVLSVLIRRAALSSPGLAAQLHLAAAEARDERPEGSWHTEWPVLAQLSRHALAAASQTTELVGGLQVDTARMAATAAQHAGDLLAEQRSLADLTGGEHRTDPSTYLGASGNLVDQVLQRAREESP